MDLSISNAHQGDECKHGIYLISKYVVPIEQVSLLETLKIAPEGSTRVSTFLEKALEGLVDGGR